MYTKVTPTGKTAIRNQDISYTKHNPVLQFVLYIICLQL